MNYRIAVAFVIYYLLMAGFYHFGSPYLNGSTTTNPLGNPDTNISLNSSDYSNSSGYVPGQSDFFSGIWNFIKGIPKALGFIFFGLGLPSDTPAWFSYMFMLWQTGIFILAILFIIGAIWNG